MRKLYSLDFEHEGHMGLLRCRSGKTGIGLPAQRTGISLADSLCPFQGLLVMLTLMTWPIARWVLDQFAPRMTTGFKILPPHLQKPTLLEERTSLLRPRAEAVGAWEEGAAQPEAQTWA